jgi:hypothetical protein
MVRVACILLATRFGSQLCLPTMDMFNARDKVRLEARLANVDTPLRYRSQYWQFYAYINLLLLLLFILLYLIIRSFIVAPLSIYTLNSVYPPDRLQLPECLY